MSKFFKVPGGGFVNLNYAANIHIKSERIVEENGDSYVRERVVAEDNNHYDPDKGNILATLHVGTAEECQKYMDWLQGELNVRHYREMDTEFPRGLTWTDLQNFKASLRRHCRWGKLISFEGIMEDLRPFFPRVPMMEQRDAVRRTLHALVLKGELTWDAKTGLFGLTKEEDDGEES